MFPSAPTPPSAPPSAQNLSSIANPALRSTFSIILSSTLSPTLNPASLIILSGRMSCDHFVSRFSEVYDSSYGHQSFFNQPVMQLYWLTNLYLQLIGQVFCDVAVVFDNWK